MNERLFTILSGARRLEIFGLDDDGVLAFLAQHSSWLEVLAVFRSLPTWRRPISLVVAGPPPPESFLDALAPLLDTAVLVPGNWLHGIPSHLRRVRARRAARLATAHLHRGIQTRCFLDDGPTF